MRDPLIVVQRTALAVSFFVSMTTALAAQGSIAVAPPHRRHQAVAYDPASKRVLLYGGLHVAGDRDTPVLDDLWTWDGRQWRLLSQNTGTGMILHKLFADGSGGVFTTGVPRPAGAFSRGPARGVTLRLEGQRWVTVADSAPIREGAGGAWDSARQRFVLFGGLFVDHYAADTWEFDGRRWQRVSDGGPPPTLGAAMSYDSRRKVMVLFGGLDIANHKFADTWEWDGIRWTKASSTGPSARFGAGITYDATRGETILFGGVDSANTKLDDTWRWNGKTWQRAATTTAPPPRSEGYLAYDAARNVTVLFGGEGAQAVPSLGDTWEWNGMQWRKVQ